MAFKLHRGAAKATDFNGNGQNFENSAILKARKLMGIIGKRFMLEEKLAISLCSLILPTIDITLFFSNESGSYCVIRYVVFKITLMLYRAQTFLDVMNK